MNTKKISSRILEDAQTLVKLYDNITQSYKNKAEHPQAWEEACALFHDSYDRLAFPSGLSEGLDALKKLDSHAIEVALEYLKVDPYYHRSGYTKKKIVHILKSIPLTNEQIKQLQEIVLNALKSKHLLYMEYGRLARNIQDPEFRAKIEHLLTQSTDQREIRRAKKMLLAMDS
jgi:hypothetical protein